MEEEKEQDRQVRAGRKCSRVPVLPSLSEAALQDLPFLWVHVATLFLFSVFVDARGRNTFSTTCVHNHCFQMSNDFAHHRNDEEKAFFLGLFSFWHWSASCYEHNDMNKERQLKKDKLMFLQFTSRKRDFLILYIKTQVPALTMCTSWWWLLASLVPLTCQRKGQGKHFVRVNIVSKLQRPCMQGTVFVFHTRSKAEPVMARMVRTRGEWRFPLPFEAEEESGEDKEGRLSKAWVPA